MTLHSPRAAGAARALRAASLAAAFAAGVVSACAAPATGGVDVRIVVKLTEPSKDMTAIAEEATRRAGVPATYAAGVDPIWHALVLHCVDAPACDTAMLRMRQASTVYAAVELDGRKRAL